MLAGAPQTRANAATPFPNPAPRFFQNQIKSEEEFQARKSELRAAARARLDQVFEKKGKRLVVDSDDDDWSIDGSELSAWDSDVASITSMSSAVREWREEAHFAAPAEAALQLALWATAVRGGYRGRRALASLLPAVPACGVHACALHQHWVCMHAGLNLPPVAHTHAHTCTYTCRRRLPPTPAGPLLAP